MHVAKLIYSTNAYCVKYYSIRVATFLFKINSPNSFNWACCNAFWDYFF